MNPTEQQIYIALHGHRLMKVYEAEIGHWQDGCSCLWVGDSHDQHVASAIYTALNPAVVPAIHPGQLPLIDLEVPDVGYKGIRL
jgi:hypothetical protein